MNVFVRDKIAKIPLNWQIIAVLFGLSFFVIPLVITVGLIWENGRLNETLESKKRESLEFVSQLAADPMQHKDRAALELLFEGLLETDPHLASISASDESGTRLAFIEDTEASNHRVLISTSILAKDASHENLGKLYFSWDMETISEACLDSWVRRARVAYLCLTVFAGLLLMFSWRHLIHPIKSIGEKIKEIQSGTIIGNNKIAVLTAPEFISIDEDLEQISLVKKRLEEELVRAKADVKKAEKAASSKMEFLSQMSHEIRTPVGAMLGFSRLLETAQLTSKERSYLQNINLSGELLLRILNDILDLSKIEAGGIELAEKPFKLSDLTQNVGQMMSSVVGDKTIDFNFDWQSDFDECVVGDQHRITQVLMNLISNAIKFTEAGRVDFRVGTMGKPRGGRIRVRFEVEDTGIGMTEKQLKRIFEPFLQADAEVSQRYGGTGLGLTIARGMVNRMGGELEATSEKGKGSIFSFEIELPVSHEKLECAFLPPERRDDTLSIVGRAVDKSRLKILVAEDEEVNRTLISKFFESLGYPVEFAVDGRNCVERLASGDHFDAIFLDLHMPHHPGMEIARRIKQGEFGDAIKDTKLSIMSADVTAVKEGRELGVDTFISKPINIRTLKEFLDSLGADKVEKLTRSDARPLNILVVEDQPLNRQLIGQVFTTFGFKPCFANDGLECIEMLKREPKVDMIFLDLRMPRMDGWTVARKIRNGELGEDCTDIPIAVVSAEVSSEETCREIGVDEFIPKPFDVNRIREFVDRVTDSSDVELVN